MPSYRPFLAALAGAATLATVVPAGPAAAADAWRVPAASTVTVIGHGYGHGHGMSQYGAEGAARKGLKHEQILGFYYPGTQLGQVRGRVSVLITADTSDDLVVRPRAGLQVRDTAGGSWTTLPSNGARLWRIGTNKAGDTVVAYRTHRWRPWRTLQGDGELYAGGQPITLLTPAGETAYRGRLRHASDPEGGHDTVNDVRLEYYLRGVVPLEIPASWSPEAVQAQAVAARTYAAFERSHPRASHYQICDTTSCQVYGGASAEHRLSDAAIRATARQALLADGKPAFTQFASSNGGWSAAGSAPYLTAREDPYDGWSGNPVHSWRVKLSDTDIERSWPGVGDLRSITVTRRDGNGDWGGRVASMVLKGTGGSVTVSGDTFRSVLGLRSTYLTFKVG